MRQALRRARPGNGRAHPDGRAGAGPPPGTPGSREPRARPAAALLAAALLGACLTGAGAWHAAAGWWRARAALVALTRARAAAAADERGAAALAAQVAERDRRLAAVEAALGRRGDLARVLVRVERLATATGATWRSYRADEPVPARGPAPAAPVPAAVSAGTRPGATPGGTDAPYLTLPLSLEFSGPRGALLELLASLERELPAYVPERVELRAAGEGGSLLLLAGRLYLLGR